MAKKETEIIRCSPCENTKLIGHEKILAQMIRMLKTGKLPHALLLSGPRGIGKATLAYRFARAVLAGRHEKLDPEDPIGSSFMDSKHPVFSRICQDSHSDLMVIERQVDDKGEFVSKNIKVEEARKLKDLFKLTSSETKYRIVIVDAIDHMNANAANAILKLLEEPPAYSLFLLISHAPGKLLATIPSRCHHIRMQPLSANESEQVLIDALPELTESERKNWAILAEGSPGDACYYAEYNTLSYYHDMVDLLVHTPKLNIENIYQFCEAVTAAKNKELGVIMSELFLRFLQQLMKYQATNTKMPELSGKENMVKESLFRHYTLENMFEIWDKLSILHQDVDRINLDRKTVLTQSFLAFAK